MMKRSLSLQLAALACALIVSVSALAAEQVTIVHMTHQWHGDGWHRYVKEVAEDFMREYPHIKVEVIIGAGHEYTDKFRVMTAAGTPPDITDFATGVGNLAMEGLFLDLAPYLAREEAYIREGILQNALELYSLDDMLWGMPNSLFMVVSWYNEDLLDEAGLAYPADLPLSDWNWATLRDYARKLTIDRDGDGQPEQWGLDRQSAAWEQFMASNGGYPYDRRYNPTESRWNDVRIIDAIEFNRQLIQDDRVASLDWDAATHFWTGRSGMAVVDGPGRLASLLDVTFRWDIAVQPAGPQGCHCGTVSADGFQINAYTRHPDEAWEYVKYLTTRPESIEKFLAYTGRFPALTGVHEAYPRINPAAPKNWPAFVEAAAQPGAYFHPSVPEVDRINDIVNTMLSQIWRGETDPRTGMQQVHEQVQAILDEQHR